MKSTTRRGRRMMDGKLEPVEDKSLKILAPLKVPVLNQLGKLIIFLELQQIPWARPCSHGETRSESSASYESRIIVCCQKHIVGCSLDCSML
jgi:hypothetical protein